MNLSNRARSTIRHTLTKGKKSWTKGGAGGPPGSTPKSALVTVNELVHHHAFSETDKVWDKLTVKTRVR